MDKLILTSLREDDAVAELCAGRVWRRGMLGRDDVPADPEKPFMQYGWDAVAAWSELQDTARGLATATLRLYAYDVETSFERIRQMLDRSRDTLLGLIGQVDPTTGSQVTGFEWTGTSGDQHDQVRRCNVKVATYRVTGRM